MLKVKNKTLISELSHRTIQLHTAKNQKKIVTQVF
uniref:Uncharacterized protein n=1 Tax=Anguilla anguilla TaxID=7936 RepID=A0A0E9PWG7_ANGAN